MWVFWWGLFWVGFWVWGWGRLQVAAFGGFLRVLACFFVYECVLACLSVWLRWDRIQKGKAQIAVDLVLCFFQVFME